MQSCATITFCGGGRTNPIIFFAGESLASDDWKQLETVDVDCLKSFSPLPKLLVKQLDERLQPWSIEIDDVTQPNSRTRVESYGVVYPPTPENLRPVRDAKLLLFDFAPNCDLLVQRFVHRNFGTYYQWFEHNTNAVRRESWLSKVNSALCRHSLRWPQIHSSHFSIRPVWICFKRDQPTIGTRLISQPLPKANSLWAR